MTKHWAEVFSREDIRQMRRLAYAYIKGGKEDLAIALFEAIVILDPGVPADDHTLGALYVQKGRPEEGLKTLERALQLDPNCQRSLLNKARALFLLERNDEATSLAEVLERGSDPTIANLAGALMMAFTQSSDDLLQVRSSQSNV